MSAPAVIGKRFFKIRHKVSGLFSAGGSDAAAWPYGAQPNRHWGKNGKIWSGTGPLRSHLTQLAQDSQGIPVEWEVIEYTLAEVSSTPVTEMLSNNALLSILKRKNK